MPTVDAAIQNMINDLATYKRQGYKAVIIIHGYGASGVGGGIKIAVAKCLGTSAMSGIVRTFIGGERWQGSRRTFLELCKGLESHERHIANNEGITVAILR